MMNSSDILLADFESARTLPQISVEMGYLTAQMGFDFWSFTQISYKQFSQPKRSVIGNMPREWQTAYQQGNFVMTDPVIEHGLQSDQSVVWGDELFAKELSMWRQAQRLGLCHGWSQSSCVMGSSSVGILSLVRNERAIQSEEVRKKQHLLSWIARSVHHKSVGLQPALVNLSEKETTIMRWTADGKTTAEIADILLVKERSVTFQIAKVLVRMGAQNKTAAAVRLAMCGLLN